jgi:hypothetical protein
VAAALYTGLEVEAQAAFAQLAVWHCRLVAMQSQWAQEEQATQTAQIQNLIA